MTTIDQWCNHDTPAIDRHGVCECGARVRAFPAQDVLAAHLVGEFGKTAKEAAIIACDLSGDGSWFNIDVSTTSHSDYRTLARVGGWYLVLPYRTDEAINR